MNSKWKGMPKELIFSEYTTPYFGKNGYYNRYPKFIYEPDCDYSLICALRRQIEYYFSEENLNNDKFIKEKMDKNGYLPLSLIATFFRIHSITKDINTIILAIETSYKIDLIDGWKVTQFNPTGMSALSASNFNKKSSWMCQLLPQPKLDPLTDIPTEEIPVNYSLSLKEELPYAITDWMKYPETGDICTAPDDIKDKQQSIAADVLLSEDANKIMLIDTTEESSCDTITSQVAKTAVPTNEKTQLKVDAPEFIPLVTPFDPPGMTPRPASNLNTKSFMCQLLPQPKIDPIMDFSNEEISESPRDEPSNAIAHWMKFPETGDMYIAADVLQSEDANKIMLIDAIEGSSFDTITSQVSETAVPKHEKNKLRVDAPEFIPSDVNKIELIEIAEDGLLDTMNNQASKTVVPMVQKLKLNPSAPEFYPAYMIEDTKITLHPLHILLDDQKYSPILYKKLYKRSMLERDLLGPNKSRELASIYKFWCFYLVKHYSLTMYQEFKNLAVEDNAIGYKYGIECLFRFYSYGLEKVFRINLYQDFQNLTLAEYKKGKLYGLEKFWAFMKYYEFSSDLCVKKELKKILSKFHTLNDFKKCRELDVILPPKFKPNPRAPIFVPCHQDKETDKEKTCKVENEKQ